MIHINYNPNERWEILYGLTQQSLNREPQKATIYLQSDKFEGMFGGEVEIPNSIPVTDADAFEGIKSDDYTVTTIVVKSKEWNLFLPETIENVIIDRNNYHDKGGRRSFRVHENNKYLMSENGSLYSKDGKVLFHYDYSKEQELNSNVEEILPGAIGSCRDLIIPSNCKKLAKKAIVGEFNIIDFTGGLNIIEQGALSEIECNELRINGLLSDINHEGQQELNELYHKTTWKHRACPRICFMAPMPTGGKAFENGYIELSQVLSSEQKLNGFVDTRPISINSYINERFKSARVPIVIEEIELSEKTWELYDASPNASRICFVDRENREHAVDIYVHEKRERVLELIDESFRIARSK